VAITVVLPSAESQNNGTEIHASAGVSYSGMGTDGSQHSVGRCKSECDHSHVDRVGVSHDACSVCNNEINGSVAGQGILQCLSDVSKDLCLPEFTNPNKKILSIFLMICNHTFSSGVCWIHLS